MEKKIMFVCLGNICRSPLAEAVFNHKAKGKAYVSDSSGTAAYHIGESPDERTIKVAKENGIVIDHQSAQFHKDDFEKYDYIIVMDENNYEEIKSISDGTHQHIHLLCEFDNDIEGDVNVPDPYYGGYDGFENIYKIINQSVEGLIAHLDKQQSL